LSLVEEALDPVSAQTHSCFLFWCVVLEHGGIYSFFKKNAFLKYFEMSKKIETRNSHVHLQVLLAHKVVS
jgi:hypothetical protein